MVVMYIVAAMLLMAAPAHASSYAPFGFGRSVDVSQPVSAANMACLMHNHNITMVIPRIYRETGAVDTNGINTVQTAREAGVPHVGAYIYPNRHSVAPDDQIAALTSSLRAKNLKVDTLWLDIEGNNWGSSKSANQQYIIALMNACLNFGYVCGIYSSYYQWENIVGLSWNVPANRKYPIWYAHYDNEASFSDFKPFGGWSRPYSKQYKGDITLCGTGVDESIYSL